MVFEYLCYKPVVRRLKFPFGVIRYGLCFETGMVLEAASCIELRLEQKFLTCLTLLRSLSNKKVFQKHAFSKGRFYSILLYAMQADSSAICSTSLT